MKNVKDTAIKAPRMIARHYLPVIFCLLLTCLGCEKWNLPKVDFIELEITDIQAPSIDSVVVRGEVRGIENIVGTVPNYGIIWTTQAGELTIDLAEGSKRFSVLDNQFVTELVLEPNREYRLVVYATQDNGRNFYSQERSFTTGSGMAFTYPPVYLGGYTLRMLGRVSGLDKGLTIVQHGFCWSATNTDPRFDADTVQLGALQRDTFSYQLPPADSLQNNTPYYIRSYAVFKNSVGETTVFGDLMTFDGDLNFWTEKAARFPGNGANASISFVIDSTAYVGLGYLGRRLYAYHPEQDRWTEMTSLPAEAPIAGVAFTIGKKAYVGLGSGFSGGPEVWEFDPYTVTSNGGTVTPGKWTRVADFPGPPRWGGVGFAIGNKGYIGCGQTFFLRNDFWEFDTTGITVDTTNGVPVERKGIWMERDSLPGAERVETVGFSVGDKGYIGLGRGTDSGFYEYHPETGTWIEKTPFPDRGRKFALSFVLNGKAYVGMGADIGTNKPKSDIWMFDPQAGELGDHGYPLGEWYRQADHPSTAPDGIAFAINGKGYAGLSANQKILWEFDP